MAQGFRAVLMVGLFGAAAWAGYALSAPPPGDAPPASPGPTPVPRVPAVVPLLPDDGSTTIGDTDTDPRPAPVVPPAPAPGEPVRITFDDLTQWDLDPENVQVPKSILLYSEKKVDIVGYMVPYGDPESVTEFLLVNDLGSCCFGQTPLPHHLIEGKMAGGKTTLYFPGPVRVRGKFRVEEHRMGKYLVSVYAMDVESCVEVR